MHSVTENKKLPSLKSQTQGAPTSESEPTDKVVNWETLSPKEQLWGMIGREPEDHEVAMASGLNLL